MTILQMALAYIAFTVSRHDDFKASAWRNSDSDEGHRFAERCDRHQQWRPSIHMPRWASRITLEITEVRAERVQEISEGDAKAEGCGLGCTVKSERFGRYMSAGQYAFASLWDSINANRGLGWEANPWVWVIGFRKLERAG
jgi:hypothetical protein